MDTDTNTGLLPSSGIIFSPTPEQAEAANSFVTTMSAGTAASHSDDPAVMQAVWEMPRRLAPFIHASQKLDDFLPTVMDVGQSAVQFIADIHSARRRAYRKSRGFRLHLRRQKAQQRRHS